jgi:hypothetical protein
MIVDGTSVHDLYFVDSRYQTSDITMAGAGGTKLISLVGKNEGTGQFRIANERQWLYTTWE